AVERGSPRIGGAVDLGIERRRSLTREQFEIGLQACARKKTLLGVRGAVPISRERFGPTLRLRRYFTRLPGERFRTSLADQIEQRAEALDQEGMITFERAAERSVLRPLSERVKDALLPLQDFGVEPQNLLRMRQI